MSQESIKKKIKALFDKAKDGASSEAETMACIEKAQALMHQYNVASAEIEIEEGQKEIEIIQDKSISHKLGRGIKISKAWDCWVAIQDFCDVRVLFITSRILGIRYASIIGTETDVEYSKYIFELIDKSLEIQYRKYVEKNGTSRGAKANFQKGMAKKISLRLYDMAEEAKNQLKKKSTNSGTALVVLNNSLLKDEKIQDWIDGEYGKVSIRSKKEQNYTNIDAAVAGSMAGDEVNLGRPITQKEQNKLLLGVA